MFLANSVATKLKFWLNSLLRINKKPATTTSSSHTLLLLLLRLLVSSCCFFSIRSFFFLAEFFQQFCLFVVFLHLQDGELYGLHVLEEEVVVEEEEEEEKQRRDEHVTWHDAKENNWFARG
jgi:hypothetical protein